MSGWLVFLLFGVGFFLLMRVGCGAHAGHGGHQQHDGSSNPLDKGGKDPVCGMQVEPNKGFAKEYNGTPYRFCSKNCLDKFELTPAKYVGPQTEANNEHHHKHGC